jgi:alpha-L-fucosidase
MLDNDELTVLDGITKWMAVNSEGIYATKPWKIYGEGPQASITKNPDQVNAAQAFNENKRKELTHEDVRFTTKDNTLYAFFMGWPEGDGKEVVIRPLGNNSAQKVGSVESVELLGSGKVEFKREDDGLKVTLPAQRPGEYAYALKIRGRDLV